MLTENYTIDIITESVEKERKTHKCSHKPGRFFRGIISKIKTFFAKLFKRNTAANLTEDAFLNGTRVGDGVRAVPRSMRGDPAFVSALRQCNLPYLADFAEFAESYAKKILGELKEACGTAEYLLHYYEGEKEFEIYDLIAEGTFDEIYAPNYTVLERPDTRAIKNFMTEVDLLIECSKKLLSAVEKKNKLDGFMAFAEVKPIVSPYYKKIEALANLESPRLKKIYERRLADGLLESQKKSVLREDIYSDYNLYQILEQNGYKTTAENLQALKEGIDSDKYDIVIDEGDSMENNLQEARGWIKRIRKGVATGSDMAKLNTPEGRARELASEYGHSAGHDLTAAADYNNHRNPFGMIRKLDDAKANQEKGRQAKAEANAAKSAATPTRESVEYLSDYELYQILESNGYKTTEKNLAALKEGLENGDISLDLNEAIGPIRRMHKGTATQEDYDYIDNDPKGQAAFRANRAGRWAGECIGKAIKSKDLDEKKKYMDSAVKLGKEGQEAKKEVKSLTEARGYIKRMANGTATAADKARFDYENTVAGHAGFDRLKALQSGRNAARRLHSAREELKKSEKAAAAADPLKMSDFHRQNAVDDRDLAKFDAHSGKTYKNSAKEKEKRAGLAEELSDYELYQILESNGYKTTEMNLQTLKEGLESGKYELQPKDLNEASTAMRRAGDYLNGNKGADYTGKGATQLQKLHAGETYGREYAIVRKKYGAAAAEQWKTANPPSRDGSLNGRLATNVQAAQDSLVKKAVNTGQKRAEAGM